MTLGTKHHALDLKRVQIQHCFVCFQITMGTELRSRIQVECLVIFVVYTAFCYPHLLPEENMLESKTNCSIKYIHMRIKVENCIPIRIVARACSGACASYTSVSMDNPQKLETKCDCCQYVGRRRKRFGMRCPDKTNKGTFHIKVVSITMPRRCTCRPCSALANRVISAEQVIFRKSPLLGDGFDKHIFY